MSFDFLVCFGRVKNGWKHQVCLFLGIFRPFWKPKRPPEMAPKARASRANRSKRSESGERSPEGAASRVSSPEGAASRVPREAAAGRGARDEPKAKSQATVQYIYYVYICLSLKIVGGGPPLFFEFGPQTAANGSPRRPYSGDKIFFCQKKIFPLHFGHFLPGLWKMLEKWVKFGRKSPRGLEK